MQTKTAMADEPTSHDGWEQQWIQAFAAHAKRRFETRALVKASVQGEEPVALDYVYAIKGGGLVLVVAGEGGHGGHAEGHGGGRDTDNPAHAELWTIFRGTGVNEIWLSNPNQAVFYVERAAEGTLSTGFGLLGLSRTPDLIVPRSAVTPIREKGHKHP